MRRQEPDSSRPRRLPITPAILKRLRHAWSQLPITYNQTMLWAACLLGFFGFLRLGEFTCSHGRACAIECSDVAVDRREDPIYMTIKLRRHKTDQSGRGTTIVISRTGDDLCPVAVVLAFMVIRPNTPGLGNSSCPGWLPGLTHPISWALEVGSILRLHPCPSRQTEECVICFVRPDNRASSCGDIG